MQRRQVTSDGERAVKRTRTIAEETSNQAAPEPADSFSTLPPEISSQIISQLALKEIGLLSQISTFWASLDWKILIKRDFGIPIQTLEKFAQLVYEINPELNISFATIYQRLSRLKKQAEKDEQKYHLNTLLIVACMQPHHHLSMLAICLNQSSAALLVRLIPPDEKVMWLTIAIFAHANNILMLLSDANSILPKEVKNFIFYKIKYSDNPLLIDFLFDPIFDFNFKPEQHEFAVTAFTGNLALLKAFMEHSPFQPDQGILDNIAAHGNVEMFDYVAKMLAFPENLSTVQRVGHSGNIEFIKHVAMRVGLPPDKITLDNAAFTGKTACVHQLIEEYELEPDDITLHEAARSRNVELTEYLADTYQLPFSIYILNQLAWYCSPAKLVELANKYSVTPDQKTLEIIAYQADLNFLYDWITRFYHMRADLRILGSIAGTGRLNMLRDFINRYALTPGAETLQSACESGNLDMILYLVNTFNLALDMNNHNHATYTRNWYRVIRYLLEQARVVIDKNRYYISDEKTVLLYQAAFAMQRAFKALEQHDYDIARAQLALAAQHSPRHFFAVAVRAVLEPAAYSLEADGVDVLINAMREAAEQPVSIMEASEIYSLLLDSGDERLQALAEAFAPLADVRCSEVARSKRAFCVYSGES